MIVRAGRQELYSIAIHAAKAAARNSTIEALKGIHVEADAARGLVTLTATNTEVAVRASLPATVQEGGTAVVPAQLFTGILQRLPEAEVKIASSDGNRMDFSAGTASYRIAVLPADKYPMPELPFPEDSVAVQGIRSLYRRTVFAAATDNEKPVFTCIKLTLTSDGLRACACNGACMAEARGDESCKGRVELLIPASSLGMLASMSQDADVYQMGITGKSVVFWDGTLLFSARVMEGTFVDANTMFSAITPLYTVQAKAEDLTRGVAAASAVAGRERLKLEFREHELYFSSESAYGAGATPVPAIVASAPPAPFYYNPRVLLNYLRTMKGDVTLSFSGEGHMTITGGGVRYLQMAMRPPQPEKKDGKAPKKAAPAKEAA